MFKTLKNAWRIPELKRKLLFTLLIIVPVSYTHLRAHET